MPSLFELSDMILALESAFNNCPDEEPEARENLVWAYLETTQERDHKFDGYAALITEMEARARCRKEEAERLAARARRDEEQAKFLKERLTQYFQRHGLGTVETARYRLTLTRNGGKTPVCLSVPPEELPEEFVRETVTRKADLEMIREALEAGQEIPGAALGERGSSVRIR
jgi:hypothetical protein